MADIQTGFLIIKCNIHVKKKSVICGQMKVERCEKIFFKNNRSVFPGQSFPELLLTTPIIIDEMLQDTIRYVLIPERRAGAKISEAPTVIRSRETAGKREKPFCRPTGKGGRKRLPYHFYRHEAKVRFGVDAFATALVSAAFLRRTLIGDVISGAGVLSCGSCTKGPFLLSSLCVRGARSQPIKWLRLMNASRGQRGIL